jgi:hypothetical protein
MSGSSDVSFEVVAGGLAEVLEVVAFFEETRMDGRGLLLLLVATLEGEEGVIEIGVVGIRFAEDDEVVRVIEGEKEEEVVVVLEGTLFGEIVLDRDLAEVLVTAAVANFEGVGAGGVVLL